MIVGESLIGGFSAAEYLGTRIEELARRASGVYSEIERCYWEFGDIFGRGAWFGESPEDVFFGGAEDGSADREVSLRGLGANGSSAGAAAFLDHSSVLENIVSDVMRTGGATNDLYELSGSAYNSYSSGDRLYYDMYDGYERDIIESCINFGDGYEERSAWFNGASEGGYQNIGISAEDLYYGLGGAEIGLPAPSDIAFGAVTWNSSSLPRYETARTELAFGEDTWEASSLPRMIGSADNFDTLAGSRSVFGENVWEACSPRMVGFSEFPDIYGELDIPRISGDELHLLRNSAADGHSANAEISVKDGSEFFGGNEAFFADDVHDAYDLDYIIDYLVSGVKTALESGAEGVHS